MELRPLWDARQAAGATQAHLARLAGVNRVTIWRIERGISRPRHTTRAAIANALSCNPSEISWPGPERTSA